MKSIDWPRLTLMVSAGSTSAGSEILPVLNSILMSPSITTLVLTFGFVFATQQTKMRIKQAANRYFIARSPLSVSGTTFLGLIIAVVSMSFQILLKPTMMQIYAFF